MKSIALLIALTICTAATAQKKIRTVEVSDTILHAFVDRPGELYLVSVSGHMQRFDTDGHLAALTRRHRLPTLFDPRDGARLFAYYRETQEYEFMSPTFETVSGFRIDSSFAIQPWLICPSGDHRLWVLDQADHSLKKINPNEGVVEVEVVIDSTIIGDVRNFTTMRDYQGFVFLHNPRGILIFSSMGRYLRTIEAPGVASFNFLGEELYFAEAGRIRFFDLFSAEFRETNAGFLQGEVLLTDIRLFHIRPRSVDIYPYTP